MKALQETRKDFVLEKKIYHCFSNISSDTFFWREVKALPPDCVVKHPEALAEIYKHEFLPGRILENIHSGMLASREPPDQKWSHTCVLWSGYIDHKCPMPTEVRRGGWVSRNWRSLRAAMWVLGIKPGSSRRVASTFNHWAIVSPAQLDKFRNVKFH